MAATVRTDALKVDETGCGCHGCRAFWASVEFEWLAKVLGCEAL